MQYRIHSLTALVASLTTLTYSSTKD